MHGHKYRQTRTKRRSSSRRKTVHKTHKKAPKALREQARKYGVRTTHTVNGKRVPKREALLRLQVIAKKRVALKKKAQRKLKALRSKARKARK